MGLSQVIPLHYALALLKMLSHDIIIIHNSSAVLGCFLDASKAFDMVDQGVTFRDRGLPLPILRFMLSWYATQQMQVRWGSCLSDVFHVSNGVRQGSVLSPVLFAVYLDGLLAELSGSGVGCYWGSFICRCVLLYM